MPKVKSEAKTYSTGAFSSRAAQALGNNNGHSQVRVVCQAPTLTAFARALIASGLENGSLPAVTRRIKDYTSETQNPAALAAAASAPGTVFVTLMYLEAEYLAWPAPAA